MQYANNSDISLEGSLVILVALIIVYARKYHFNHITVKIKNYIFNCFTNNK